MTLLRLALAALFACALALDSADARAPDNPNNDRGHQGGNHGGRGGRDHGRDHGGKADKEAAPAPEPSAPAGPSGTPGAGDGSGADARGSYRLFCDRWRSDYWCQPGPPYVLPTK